MQRFRPLLALLAGIAGAALVPATGAAAAPHTLPPSPDSGSAKSAPSARALLEAGLERSGHAASNEAEAQPASSLYVSDGLASWNVPVNSSGVPSGSPVKSTARTDVVVGPAGDAMAYRIPGSSTVKVSAIGASSTVTYDESEVPVGWAPFGDGFTTRKAGALTAQATNPWMSAELVAPDGATDAAVSPYGGSAVVRAPGGSGTQLSVVPTPFFSTTGTSGGTIGLSEYTPGLPTLAQEPGAGAFPGDDGATFLAFEGTDPKNATEHHLYVDHQDGGGAGGTTYTNPVVVAEAGARCDAAAPAFDPTRKLLAYVKAVGTTPSSCSKFEVRVKRAGSDNRFASSDSEVLVWSGASGAPAPTVLSWGAKNPTATEIRVGGANRYEVAYFTSLFYEENESDAVVLAGGKAYADALAGGPLAVASKGPSLLTPSSSLHPAARAAIEETLKPGGTVYILGGTVSVSNTVKDDLVRAGYKVTRLAGDDRYEVAVNVAKELDRLRGRKPTTAFVSSGTAFADALVAGPPAAQLDAPVLLSNRSKLPGVTKAYLDSLSADADIFAIGGSGAQSVIEDDRTTVIGGDNRYEVASNVLDSFFPASWVGAIADGRNWPDAVSGGAFMGLLGEPILLTNGYSTLPDPTQSRLLRSRASLDYMFAFGGPKSVADGALENAVKAAGDQTTYFGADG
ncbi:cell wall-binding repeat-containing protein [Phycicoccus sp. CSK15P-2]|uniref:cell wall-binding repeat-containing protein n=1 Tax=Phycicoccus sp. CSK15P-2 TaxID=2807627 RepID=UPI00194F7720|nr:cell wall-binding repeat-containing protein [Phycicoccus sp. CSK15P-2]MBM6404360.1 cell wall-binding repeat-containing protein [Phycicoccus sp. CSK15P-2]